MKELEETGELLVELGSDQTSCHNPFNGGYYPVQIGFEEAQTVSHIFVSCCPRVFSSWPFFSFQAIAEEPDRFKELVEETLRRHVKAVNALSDAG